MGVGLFEKLQMIRDRVETLVAEGIIEGAVTVLSRLMSYHGEMDPDLICTGFAPGHSLEQQDAIHQQVRVLAQGISLWLDPRDIVNS